MISKHRLDDLAISGGPLAFQHEDIETAPGKETVRIYSVGVRH